MNHWKKYKGLFLLTLMIFMFFILSGMALAAEEEVEKSYGFLSLIATIGSYCSLFFN